MNSEESGVSYAIVCRWAKCAVHIAGESRVQRWRDARATHCVVAAGVCVSGVFGRPRPPPRVLVLLRQQRLNAICYV